MRRVIVLSLLIASCGDDDASPDTGPLDSGSDSTADSTIIVPDDYWGLSSDPLPEGAELVSPEELDRRVEAGEAFMVHRRALLDQEAAAAARELADDQTIAEWEAMHPGRTLMPPPPPADDPGAIPLGDDYLHPIVLVTGETSEVVTMGRRWQKATIAQSLRTEPTRANQLAFYEELYADLDTSWRRSLALADPSTLGAATVEEIRDFNDAIALQAIAIADSIPFEPDPPDGWVASCDLEVGWYDDSDTARSRFSGECDRSPTGIFESHEWFLKHFVTCVGDQWKRGSCTVFANTSAIEMLVARRHDVWVNLSEQAHSNRMKLVWERNDFWEGMVSQFGFSKMTEEGWLLPFENQWPYNPSFARTHGIRICSDSCLDEACKAGCRADPDNWWYERSCEGYSDIVCSDTAHQSLFICADSGDLRQCAAWVPDKNPGNQGYRITTSASIWDPADVELSHLKIIVALALGKPVVIGHPITDDWDEAAKRGVGIMSPYNGTTQTQRGGHGVHVVGFISNTRLASILPSAPAGAGGGYFIIKNSWSNCTGDGGFLYVPYQSVKDWTPDATILHGVM